jgi:hypothetical protein
VSSAPPTIPWLADPPREVPAGVRLHILNHHSVNGTLWFTLPAAVMLLLAAIGQPMRGARTALGVFAAVLLLLAVRVGLPPLRRALRRVHRMASGFVTMGRIVSCRLEGQGERAARPYEEFLRDYTAIIGAWQLSMALGCPLGFFFLSFAAMTGLPIIAFVITATARLINPAIDAGDMDFDNFLRFCLALIGVLVMVLIVRAIWRKAAVPIADAYIRDKVRQGMANEDEYHRQMIQKALDGAAKVGLKVPLPARSDNGIPLTCKIEYVAMGEPRTATGGAVLGSHLNLAGLEPLLFDPLNPGEVELFAGLSSRITVQNGQWQPIGSFGSATSLTFAGAVMALDAVVLLAEIVALAR